MRTKAKTPAWQNARLKVSQESEDVFSCQVPVDLLDSVLRNQV